MSLDSYGSEGEFVGKTSGNGGSEYGMPNYSGDGGGGKLILDALLKFSSLVIYPIFAMMVILFMQNSTMDKRLSLMEDRMSRPEQNLSLSNDIAVIKDRQLVLMRKVELNDNRIDKIEINFESHRQKSTYEDNGKRRQGG